MLVTMAYVVSLNGKITRGHDPRVHDWSSEEDFRHFTELKATYTVLIMGRGTYEAVRPQSEAGTLRIVLTHHPERFSDAVVPGRLEFTSEAPATLIQRLKTAGQKRVLLVGGGSFGAQFLAEHLVDDLYLTFEPVIFGQGISFVDETTPFNTSLQLLEVSQLNERGTLCAHYKVITEPT